MMQRHTGLGAVESSVWPTTGDIDAETQSLATTIATLGHDIAGSGVDPSTIEYQSFERAWNGFVTDFLAWQDAPWFWNPTRRDQLVSYRQRYNQLLASYKTLPASYTAQEPVSGDHPEPDSLDNVMRAVKWGGIALGVYLGVRLLYDTGVLRKLR